jgi:hypothetical protein
MAYGIRLANGEVQIVSERSALTNAQTDGLLGGGAELVWIDARGAAKPLPLLHETKTIAEVYDDENATSIHSDSP